MNNLYEKKWHVLNIDVSSAIKAEYDFNYLFEQTEGAKHLWEHNWCQWYFSEEQLADLFKVEWLEYMKSLDLEIQHAYIFFKLRADKPLEAHVDTQATNNFSIAMNWVVGYDPSPMLWFNTPEWPYENQYTSPTGKVYYTWDAENLTEVDRRVIGNKLTLVRVDTPHEVVIKDFPRLCIGVRTKKKFARWEDIVDHIKKHIRPDAD